MKVWLDRNAMAAREITVADIERVIRSENVELPAGEVESNDRDFEVRVARSFLSPEDFADLTIKAGIDGYLVKLGEVAIVELASEDDETQFRGDGVIMIGMELLSNGSTIDRCLYPAPLPTSNTTAAL